MTAVCSAHHLCAPGPLGTVERELCKEGKQLAVQPQLHPRVLRLTPGDRGQQGPVRADAGRVAPEWQYRDAVAGDATVHSPLQQLLICGRQAFLSGVYDVLPNLPALASCLQPAELRKLWCGTQEVPATTHIKH